MDKSVENSVENPGTAAGPVCPFESFRPGQRYRSRRLTMDRGRIQRFAEVSGDRNPIHVDPEFAARTIHRGPIAHGLLIAAVATGLAYDRGLLGPNMLALQSSEERYLAPVRPGDVIYGDLEILSVDPEAARKYGQVVWGARLFKCAAEREDVLVFEARWTTLVFKEAYLPRR